MPIVSISRDWGVSPSIVRMETTDDFATITAAGYLADQADVIEDLIHGVFQWVPSDVISIYYNGGQAFFTRDATTDSLVPEVDIPAGSITTAMLQDHCVTYVKMQNVSATDKVLGRQSAGAGTVEEITCTAAGRALLDDASATAQRATLGLGDMAVQNASAVAITGGTLAGAVTGVTQAPGDNSTKLATTAYADAASSVTYPISLANGGTNAALVADNGGIFYSTAGAGAILASTATASQILQSGSHAAPSWSTATYPATTTINRILYSSAANTISEIVTGNNGLLVTSGGGVPSISTAIPNGVTATTQSASDNSTKLATTAYVDSALSGAGGSLTYPPTSTAQKTALGGYRIACVPGLFKDTTLSDSQTAGISTPLNARVIFVPYFSFKAVSFIQIRIWVTTGAAASSFTAGYYASDSDGLPTGAALAAGTAATTSSAAGAVASVSVSLSANTLYWLGIQLSTSTTLAIATATLSLSPGMNVAAPAATISQYWLAQVNTYSAGTLPTIGTLTTTGTFVSSLPVMWLT